MKKSSCHDRKICRVRHLCENQTSNQNGIKLYTLRKEFIKTSIDNGPFLKISALAGVDLCSLQLAWMQSKPKDALTLPGVFELSGFEDRGKWWLPLCPPNPEIGAARETLHAHEGAEE